MLDILKFMIFAFLICVSTSSGQDDWQSRDELKATATGGDDLVFLTNANNNVNMETSERTYTGSLVAGGAQEIEFETSSYMTGIGENGEAVTEGKETKTKTNLPSQYLVAMLHQMNFDFSDPSSISYDTDTMLKVFAKDMKPEGLPDNFSDDSSFPDADIFSLVSSSDSLEDMIDASLLRVGDGVTLDKLIGLSHEITYNNYTGVSRDGVSCYYGDSKNTVIRLV